MNETISALQSAITVNRKNINMLHQCILKTKSILVEYPSHKYAAHLLKKTLVKEDKSIAQLVRIQKMLKKQLAREISDLRVRASIKKIAKNYTEEL